MTSFFLNQIVSYIKAQPLSKKQGEKFIKNVAGINEAQEGDITFLLDKKYEQAIYQTKATAVVVEKSFKPQQLLQPILLYVDNPRKTLKTLLEVYETHLLSPRSGVSEKADIDPSVKIEEDVYIGPFVCIESDVHIGRGSQLYANAYVGKGVRIGRQTVIFSGAKIYPRSQIGNKVTIESGAVVGSSGFGFLQTESGEYEYIPQLGNVIIEDNVYMGANATIDRATIGSTLIKEGCKIDNLVQIAHNVQIGKNTAIVAQVGIAGSTKVGERVKMGGQVGVSGHIEIADGVSLGARSGVAHSIKEKGAAYFGAPAIPFREEVRQQVYIRHLPEMEKRIQTLENKSTKEKDANSK